MDVSWRWKCPSGIPRYHWYLSLGFILAALPACRARYCRNRSRPWPSSRGYVKCWDKRNAPSAPSRMSGFGRHSAQQQRKRGLETFTAHILASIVAQPHNDQVMGRNNYSELTTCAVHVITIPGHRQRSIPVDPKEPPIDRPAIGGPGGSHLADELHEAFRQHPPAFPHTILQVQVAEP